MSKISLLKAKIVQVTSYYPPHLGGMENVVKQIAEGFVDKGYTVSVYTSDIGYSQKAVVDSKAQVYYLKSIEFAHTPIIFTLFFRLLILPRHSLIHLHAAQAFTPEVVYVISKLRRIPYITHIHLDVDPSGPLGFLLGPYKKFFFKKVLKSAAKLICVSEAQKKSIAAKYALPLEAIVVIPNGVAEEYFIEEKTRENAVPRLLFVGRLAVQKNLPLLIEAISHMQESTILDIVGDGELRKDVEDLIQKYGLQNVQLHGKKTGKELLEFYKSADISVLPSFKEAGASLSMLEALAARLPIVAADSPEVREMLADCGVLVQDAKPITYAKALDALLSDKDTLRNLRVLSVQKARNYSWGNLLNSIESVYKGVIYNDGKHFERQMKS